MRPILFDVAGFPIRSFGILVGLGFIAGIWIATRLGRRSGVQPDDIQDLVVPWILVGSIVGARFVFVVSYWDKEFAGRPFSEVFQIWNGGLVFYGGLAGAVLAALIRIRMRRLPLWRLADCLAPGIAIGHTLGRLGCFLNGCCFGHPASVPWAVRFPSGTIPGNPLVHPAQLYEAALNLALCIGLVLLHGRRRFDGQVFAAYLIAYAFIRSFTEWFRGDYSFQSNPLAGALTPGQSASVILLVAGILLWAILRRTAVIASPAR
jgi:phosphatidylglycerol:prolipoprotein diacylglycerol transferase